MMGSPFAHPGGYNYVHHAPHDHTENSIAVLDRLPGDLPPRTRHRGYQPSTEWASKETMGRAQTPSCRLVPWNKNTPEDLKLARFLRLVPANQQKCLTNQAVLVYHEIDA